MRRFEPRQSDAMRAPVTTRQIGSREVGETLGFGETIGRSETFALQ